MKVKVFRVLLVSAASAFLLAACGGGEAPAVVTMHAEVPLQASSAPSSEVKATPVATAAVASTAASTITSSVATPVASLVMDVMSASSAPAAAKAPAVEEKLAVLPVSPPTPTTPVARITDVSLSNVAVNVKTNTVNVGQKNVNLAAFSVAFDKASPDASIQELVFKNIKGGNVYDIFTQLRLVDANGDICPMFACYLTQTRSGGASEIRVVFVYGWRPEGELKTYALQGDVSVYAPIKSSFEFDLIGVQMRQWGKTVDGEVRGKTLGVTTVVALPVVISAQVRQTVGTTPGMQYDVFSVTVACYNQPSCLVKEMKILVKGADNLQLVGSGDMEYLPEMRAYVVHPNHWIGAGASVTWNFVATATDVAVYAQVTDLVFTVDGTDLSPLYTITNTQCVDLTAKGGGNCSFGEKG